MLIDSGADYTLLPSKYATLLGIDIQKDCRKEITTGIGGTETLYQYPKLPIRIGNWQTHIPVGFLARDDVPSLLGRLKCLETLRLTFDKKQSIFET